MLVGDKLESSRFMNLIPQSPDVSWVYNNSTALAVSSAGVVLDEQQVQFDMGGPLTLLNDTDSFWSPVLHVGLTVCGRSYILNYYKKDGDVKVCEVIGSKVVPLFSVPNFKKDRFHCRLFQQQGTSLVSNGNEVFSIETKEESPVILGHCFYQYLDKTFRPGRDEKVNQIIDYKDIEVCVKQADLTIISLACSGVLIYSDEECEHCQVINMLTNEFIFIEDEQCAGLGQKEIQNLISVTQYGLSLPEKLLNVWFPNFQSTKNAYACEFYQRQWQCTSYQSDLIKKEISMFGKNNSEQVQALMKAELKRLTAATKSLEQKIEQLEERHALDMIRLVRMQDRQQSAGADAKLREVTQKMAEFEKRIEKQLELQNRMIDDRMLKAQRAVELIFEEKMSDVMSKVQIIMGELKLEKQEK